MSYRRLYNSHQELFDAFANLKYNKIKLWECRICHCMIKRHQKTKHLTSLQHFDKLRENSDCPKTINCKLWTCDACDIEIQLCNKNHHFLSYAHILNTSEDEDEAIARVNNPDLNRLCEQDFWEIHAYYEEGYLQSLKENEDKEIEKTI